MTQYLLSVWYPTDATPPPPDELEVIMRNVEAVRADMAKAGVWVFSGALHEASTATVVRATGGGDVLVTDGPFVESKEQLGGFTIIDAGDLDEALAWAERTANALGSLPVEVRPFQG
jgi:hypothetical protein